MQPYFFPYIGYFQLMQAVDLFVFYDDAQYMKGGWINRNRILLGNETSWITLPVKHDSVSLSINQRSYLLTEGIELTKRKLRAAYATVPAFAEVFPFLCELLDFQDENVATFNANLLCVLARKLGIRCDFAMSSQIQKTTGLHGEAKVIDLCQRIGADGYVNAIGGVQLYDPHHFDAAETRLSFLRTKVVPQEFDSGAQYLSIVHELMCHGTAGVADLLGSYELLNAPVNADVELS